MSDLLIAGGMIADGIGSPLFAADVLVDSGRIQGLAEPGTASADAVLDARGRVVCPGFIDMHSHSDLQLLANPAHEARLLQGITTEVLGQDGLSYAPVDDDTLARLRIQLAGWNGDPVGFNWDWRSVADYLRRLSAGIAGNAAYLVPHGTLRLLVMGGEQRPPRSHELDAMCRVLRESLRAGAIGLSAGLTYSPGMYADAYEIVALCRIVAEEGGYYCPHHRNYGADAFGGYAECIDVARRAGVALHLAHTHLSFPINAGRVEELVAMLDDAAHSGVDLTFDSYPYLAGMTSLHALLPSWVQAGSTDTQIARLRDPLVRDRVRVDLEVTGSDGNHGVPVDWTTVVISGLPDSAGYPDLVGRSLAESAKSHTVAPADLFLDVIVDSRMSASCILYMGIEEHVRRLMSHPRHTVGTDGILVGQQPHPRGWGTFARMLGRYVREEQVLDLVECIRHMTGSAAARIGARDRGRVVPGARADLVVFDPGTVTDRATYELPRQPPVGIDHVLVNGSVAVRNGTITGARSGQVIRRTSRKETRS